MGGGRHSEDPMYKSHLGSDGCFYFRPWAEPSCAEEEEQDGKGILLRGEEPFEMHSGPLQHSIHVEQIGWGG